MALIFRFSTFKYPTQLIYRVFNEGTFSQKCLKFSTSKILEKNKGTPLKYSTDKVARMEISEIIDMKVTEKEKARRISLNIIVGSLAIFMIYFCILREENDIDEKLSGNPDGKMALPELMKLKMDLIYCRKNNLPTDAIRARIDELEKDQEFLICLSEEYLRLIHLSLIKVLRVLFRILYRQQHVEYLTSKWKNKNYTLIANVTSLSLCIKVKIKD